MKKFFSRALFLGVMILTACVNNEAVLPTEETEYILKEQVQITIGDEKLNDYICSYEYSYDDGEGVVYIISQNYANTREEKENYADSITTNSGDFVVIDYRNLQDANMQIRNSYHVDNPVVRQCVLQVLLKYEENHPSRWERSEKSMNSEWYTHNISYLMGYNVNRSRHVDLNNKDEAVYAQ